MATLDDKLLGEKVHYYCSSSESEDEDVKSDDKGLTNVKIKEPNNMPDGQVENGCSNTGPKGVIKDWQIYKQLKAERKEFLNKQHLEIIKKLSITCQSSQEEKSIYNPDDSISDSFLADYRKKRMLEMITEVNQKFCFGIVVNLVSGDDFLNAIDNEDKSVPVIIHIYDDHDRNCKKINQILSNLAQAYKNVKFCQILATAAGLSINFKISGIPALLVYKNKQMIGNFIRITDELGDDFYEGDVENFLIEHGVLGNKTYIPSILVNELENDDPSD